MNLQEDATGAEHILNTIIEQMFDTIGIINLTTGEYMDYASTAQSRKNPVSFAYDIFQKQLLCSVIPEERFQTAEKLALPYIEQQLRHNSLYQFVTMTTAVNQAPSHIRIAFLYLDKSHQSLLMLQKHDEVLEHLFDARQSIERYQLIIDEMKAAVFEWNWKTGNTYASDSCKSYLLCHEKMSDILENRANPETIHPDDISKLTGFFRDTKSGKKRAEATLRMKMTDGTYQWSRLIGLFKMDADGNLERTIGIILDIDQEKKEIFEKDKFINAIPTGIGIFEVIQEKPQQTYMNDGFYRLLNDTREARLKRTQHDFMLGIHPDDRAKVKKTIQAVIAGANTATVTCRSYTGDGSFLWVRFMASVAKREKDYILVYCTSVSMEEEVRSRKAMEQSQSLLESAIKNADLCVWEYDCINCCIIQTASSMEKHGFDKIVPNVPESLVEIGYIKQETAPAFLKMYQELLETKQTVQGDFYVRNKEQNGYWWEHIILTPVLDDSGRLVKALGTSLDITERKEKEEQYYQQIGFMSENDDKNLIAKGQYNLTQKKLVYYSAMRSDAVTLQESDTIEKILVQFYSVLNMEQTRDDAFAFFTVENLLKTYNTGVREGTFPYKRKAPNAPIVFANCRYLMSCDPKSNDIMLFVYCYDETERMIEQKIVEQIGKSEYEAIGILDVQTGDYAIKNMYTDSSLPVPPIGHDYFSEYVKIIHRTALPDEQEKIIANLRMAHLIQKLEESDTYAFPYSAYSSSQEIRRKKLQFQYLDKTKTSILCTRSDITEFYRLEQEQLLKTQKALEVAKKATQAKTDFLSRMSHDIRTPLNAILGTTTLAKDETDSPAAIKEYLETIESSGRFLLGLINDILDINKIESGKIELCPKPYNVADFIRSVNYTIRPLMDKKNISFHFDMGCNHTSILVDKLRYNQIFFNLLSNAVKYTPEGGRVEFVAEQLEAPAGIAGVRNYVRDNGIGMSKEYMEHLFEPFTRDNTAMINQTEGSGLGLAIVKSIVDSMGGKIHVNSELGKGTEFIVDLYIPLCADAGPETHSEEVTPDIDFSQKRILLVEDNAININIAKKLLEKKKCSVTVATNGQEAIDTFSASKEYAFDAILMDIRMPILDGLQASKAIRSLNRMDAQNVPIIAMTADAFREDINRTEKAGMNAHLSKPVHPEKLYAALGKFIGQKKDDVKST